MCCKKVSIISLLLTIVACCGDDKATTVDLTRRDSIDVYLALSNDSRYDLETRYFYTKRAQELVAKEPSDSIKANYQFLVANRFYNQNKTTDYKLICEDLVRTTSKSRDTSMLGKSFYYLGDYYLTTNLGDSAYFFYIKAEKFFKKLNDIENLTITSLSKATVLYEENDFFESEASTLQALIYLKKKYHPRRHYEALTLLALTSCEMREYSRALKYNNIALKVIERQLSDDPERPYAVSMNNLGNIYQRMGNHTSAIACFTAALNEDNLLLKNARIYGILMDNLAYSLFQRNSDNHLSVELFIEALRVKSSQYDLSSFLFTKIRYAEYLYEKGDFIQASQLAREALGTASQENLFADMIPALKLLVKHEPDNIEYISSLIAINDSLMFKERASRNKFARIKYETDELSAQKEIAVKKRWIVTGTAGVIIIIITLLLIIQIQRLNQKEMQFYQNQQEANEQIYSLIIDQQSKIDEGRNSEKHRISRDLHDGVMNRLASIRLNLFVLNKKTDQQTIEHCIKYIGKIQDVEKEIREISHDLNTEFLNKEDSFKLLLRSFFAEQRAIGKASYQIELDNKINWDVLDTNTKVNLYRVLQEIFNNISKHSAATRVEVIAQLVPRFIEIIISDNGTGFTKGDYKNGIGIKNIKSRIKLIKGKVEFKHQMNEGVRIKLLIPF